MSKRIRKKRLLREIENAFFEVILEDGVSLHETIEIDDFRQVLKNSKAREIDEVLDWKKLLEMPEFNKICGVGGVHFFDAKGIRFHLPAYLTLAIRGKLYFPIQESVVFCLTHLSDHFIKKYGIFYKIQKK